jgi:hypothetical protein
MSSKKNPRKDIRHDITQAARLVRREIGTIKNDLLTGSESWKKSTQKIVKDNAPRVSAVLDETMTRTGDLFARAMNIVEKQTRETQTDLLRTYRDFLFRQVQAIDRRLKKSKK